MNDQKVAIPTALMQAIAEYLVKRPFDEVAGFISGLQQAAQEGRPTDVPPPPAK